MLDGFEKEFLKFSKSIYDYEEDSSSNLTLSSNQASATTATTTTTSGQDNSQEILTEYDKLLKAFNDSSNTLIEKQNRNFQQLMRGLLIVPKITGNTGYEYVKKVQSSQFNIIKSTLTNFLNYDVTFKYGNPSGFDRKLFKK